MRNNDEQFDQDIFSNVDADFKKFLKGYDIFFAHYILKNMTDEDHPISIGNLVSELSYLLPINPSDEDDLSADSINPANNTKKRAKTALFPERTLRTAIDNLMDLYDSDSPLKECVGRFFTSMFGGKIERTTPKSTKASSASSNSKQWRYYFEPLLNSSDLDMITGTLESSTYLSAEEKDYLTSRIRLLNPIADFRDDDFTMQRMKSLDEMPQIPDAPMVKRGSLPVESSTLLKHIAQLHNAIRNKYQIQISYGGYDMNETRKGHITFKPRHNGEFITINPYAMFWNRGQYYLIATMASKKSDQIFHFRVDRISALKIPYETDKKGYRTEIARSKVPARLLPYFKSANGPKESFDSIKYTTTYPNMYFFGQDNKIKCCFECTNATISILIDAFGPNIRLMPSDRNHAEKDSNGAPVKFYTAAIENIQYDNALKFATKHHEDLTLIAPAELVADVRKSLENSLKKYQTL